MNLLGLDSPMNKLKMLGISDPQIARAFAATKVPQMPEMAAPGGKVKGAGFVDRLKSGLFKAPAGMEGLLSADDISGAQSQGLLGLGASLLADSGPKTADQYTGFGASIGKAVQNAQNTYRGALDSTMAARAGMQQFEAGKTDLEAKKGELAKSKAIDAGRQSIVQRNPMPTDDVNKMASWIDATLPQFIEIGDAETVARLSEIRKSIGGGQQAARRDINTVNTGGETVMYDNATGQEIRRIPNTPTPRNPNAPDHANDMNLQRLAKRENDLSDDYRSSTKHHAEVANHYGTIVANAELAKNTSNPAAHIGLVFSFMKMQDPTSTVREGEYATAKNAGSVPQSIINSYNKALKGEFLSPKQIDDFVKAGRGVAKSWKTRQDQQRKTFTVRAKRQGVDPAIFSDYFDGQVLDDPVDTSHLVPFSGQTGRRPGTRPSLESLR